MRLIFYVLYLFFKWIGNKLEVGALYLMDIIHIPQKKAYRALASQFGEKEDACGSMQFLNAITF